MDLLKKNILSIILGLVALAAVAVAFTILPGNKVKLQAQLDERKSTYDKLHGLLSKDRQLPTVDPDNPNQASLPQFPSEKIIAQGEAIVQEVEKQSASMLEAAVAMNKHDLLVPGSLPKPMPTQAFRFRNAYQGALPLPAQGGVLQSQFAKELQAGMPPTADEIRIKQEQEAAKFKEAHTIFNSQGQPANADQVNAQVAIRTAELPKEMMTAVANNSHVYVSPDTFEINPTISAAVGQPDPMNMYFAQLGYWIQQDVVTAVNEVNAGSKAVSDSPVKHLISIRVRSAGVPTFVIQAEGQASGDPDAPLPKVPTVSPTGRVCNGLYDVFHFTVVADVEAAKLNDFLRGLGYRRFITPMYLDVKGVDNAVALAQGRVYGEKPVVNVTVECEVLYLRKWNAAFMPELIRKRLGIGEPGAAPAPATPAS